MKNVHVGFIEASMVAGLLALVSIVSTSSLTANAANKTSGKATIYAKSFAGKKTANGETYKPGAMTAASNKLPIGSKVLVKNKKTGKQAVVKINDKTAKSTSAAVDLSPAAAKKIGVKGTGQVDASVVGKSAKTK